MSSFQTVRRGKLMLKGGIPLENLNEKKNKKKKRKKSEGVEEAKEADQGKAEELHAEQQQEASGANQGKDKAAGGHDGGIGFAPDGKKSKKYEELFPVETKRFGFVEPSQVQTREEAVVERAKRKADRYCK